MIEKFKSDVWYRTNNVPVLSFKEIEQLAVDIISDYDLKYLKEPQSFDVDDFIEFYLGCDIEIVHLSHNHCYFGRYVFNEGEDVPIYYPETNKVYALQTDPNTILLDAYLTETPEREHLRRFTLMHEGGHGVTHQRYYKGIDKQLTLFDMDDYGEPQASSTSNSILGYGKKRTLKTDEDWLEYQANSFASCMLMNRMALEILLNRYSYSLKTSTLQRVFIIDEISKTFEVSYEAAEVRLDKFDEMELSNLSNDNVSLF
ncbi:ImmA/IrrE family metallo-endopeptidase [Aerococcus urinae]